MLLKNAIAKRIKQLLKENKITQYELFKRSGVPQSTISTIIKGDVETIKLSTLFALCIGFNVEFTDFFGIEYLKIANLED